MTIEAVEKTRGFCSVEPQSGNVEDQGYAFFTEQYFTSLYHYTMDACVNPSLPFFTDERAQALAEKYENRVPRAILARQILETSALELLNLWQESEGLDAAPCEAILAEFLLLHPTYQEQYYEENPSSYLDGAISTVRWLGMWLREETLAFSSFDLNN